MTRRSIFLVALVVVCGRAYGARDHGRGAGTLAQSVLAGDRCAITAFAGAAIDRTVVRSVGLVTDGALPAQRQAPAPKLPAYCRIEATVTTSDDSRVNFEVWIPRDWNGKIVVTGNGGYSNAFNVRDMAHALSQRYAAVGGDTGHQTPTRITCSGASITRIGSPIGACGRFTPSPVLRAASSSSVVDDPAPAASTRRLSNAPPVRPNA